MVLTDHFCALYPDTKNMRVQEKRKFKEQKLRKLKEQVVTIIHEYFLLDDIPKLIRCLEDLGSPDYNSIFQKKLITLAMDRKNKEKEMAFVLLSVIHIEIFTTGWFESIILELLPIL